MNQALLPPDGAPDSGFLERMNRFVIAHQTKLLVIVFVLAVVTRIGATVALQGFESGPPTWGDMKSYDDFARKITAGDWLGQPTSYREPGYPVFLAAVYKLTGGNAAAGRLANAGLGAAACLLIFVLGKRLCGGAVGLGASAWSVFYPHFIYLNTMLLRESLLILLVLVFVILMVEAAREKGRRYLIAAALLLVVVVHTDARFLFHLPFLGLFLLVYDRSWRRRLTRIALFAVIFLAGMVPWQARNYMAYDRFVLINTRTLDIQAKPIETPPSAKGEVRRLTGPRRVLYNFTEFYRVFRFRGEQRNNSAAYNAPWSLFHNVSGILTYGILIPLFLYGCYVIVRRRWRDGYILIVPILAHTVLHLLKWGHPRYRASIEPLILILAFFALAYLLRWRRERKVAA